MLTCDAYLMPRTLAEAFDAMEAHAGRFRLVAGATDLLPWAREGRAGDVAVPVLVDVTRIPELRERRVAANTVRIGAATPVQRFLDDAALAAALPAMRQCAVWFADDQIRECATIGGNLVNASPAADLAPVLLAHGAEVELAARRDGRIVTRTLPLADFLRGPGATALEPGEILLAVHCEALEGYGGAFQKVGHRRSLVIATVGLVALVRLDAARMNMCDVRLAVTGVGPVPQRLAEAEAVLRGHDAADAARIAHAADCAERDVRSRTRQAYRREVVRGFLIRALANAVRGAPAHEWAMREEAAHV